MGQLVVNEIHRPYLVGRRGRRAVLAQLCLDRALGRFAMQLQAHRAIEPTNPLGIDRPTLAS
jgi:hypothetical protein